MYSKKDFGPSAWSGGPFPDKSTRGGNSMRYTSHYTADHNQLGPGDDGREHPGIAPKQGFRKELPPAGPASNPKTGEPIFDGAVEFSKEPTADQVQKKWR
jgi:hypothetical protein